MNHVKDEVVAWKFTGIAGFKRYITDKQYKSFRAETQKWYEPYKCMSCKHRSLNQWVGLGGDEQITEMWLQMNPQSLVNFARAIEAQLKELNT